MKIYIKINKKKIVQPVVEPMDRFTALVITPILPARSQECAAG